MIAARRATVLLLLLPALWAGLGAGPAGARGLPGRILVQGDRGLELFNPRSGSVRVIVDAGAGGILLPSGRGIAYVRAGAYNSPGPYTRYSVFVKSFAEQDPRARGRQLFGWDRFFVRSVDVSRRGRLVFSAEPGPGPGKNGRGMEIYSSALDGSHVRRLTHNRVFDNDVAVSPDGRTVAFSRRIGGQAQIFAMPIGGGRARQLTHDGRRDRLPSWAPGGGRLAFISQPPGRNAFGRREIYTVGAGGGRERRITHNRVSEDRAAYAPDGRTIAFVNFEDLWLVGAGGGGHAHRILKSSGDVGFEGGLDWGR